MAFKMSMKKGINISRVITKVVATILVLYVGGAILTSVGNVMNCTHSVFNNGLTLIGWTVQDFTTLANNTCSNLDGATPYGGVITSTASGTGLLSVVGLVAVASIVMEFVKFKL